MPHIGGERCGFESTRLVDGVKVGMFGTSITVSGLVQLNTTSADLLLGISGAHDRHRLQRTVAILRTTARG